MYIGQSVDAFMNTQWMIRYFVQKIGHLQDGDK